MTAVPQKNISSPPGLIRGPIFSRKGPAKQRLDTRVKPGYDELGKP